MQFSRMSLVDKPMNEPPEVDGVFVKIVATLLSMLAWLLKRLPSRNSPAPVAPAPTLPPDLSGYRLVPGSSTGSEHLVSPFGEKIALVCTTFGGITIIPLKDDLGPQVSLNAGDSIQQACHKIALQHRQQMTNSN